MASPLILQITKVVIIMYDTVNLLLPFTEVGDTSLIEEIPCYLTDVGEHNYSRDTIITGYLNGLKVIVSQTQVKVKDGSLCKYFLGDNFQMMRRADTQQAIEKMSDELHLPMARARITRLDVAVNLIMQYPIAIYLNHLGVMRYKTRYVEPNGLSYIAKLERLLFYDKVREQRAKGEFVPEMYRGRNLLRYEQRVLQRVPNVLKQQAVTGASLYDEQFYTFLLKRLLTNYQSIMKVNDIQLNTKTMKTVSELKRMAVVELIEKFGGEVAFLNQIAEAQQRGEITAKQAHDLRKEIKKACTAGGEIVVKSDAIAELDKKLSEAVRYYR